MLTQYAGEPIAAKPPLKKIERQTERQRLNGTPSRPRHFSELSLPATTTTRKTDQDTAITATEKTILNQVHVVRRTPSPSVELQRGSSERLDRRIRRLARVEVHQKIVGLHQVARRHIVELVPRPVVFRDLLGRHHGEVFELLGIVVRGHESIVDYSLYLSQAIFYVATLGPCSFDRLAPDSRPLSDRLALKHGYARITSRVAAQAARRRDRQFSNERPVKFVGVECAEPEHRELDSHLWPLARSPPSHHRRLRKTM